MAFRRSEKASWHESDSAELYRRAHRKWGGTHQIKRNLVSSKTAGQRHLESSRCPPCRGWKYDGDSWHPGLRSKPCAISICSCKCHARLRGMGQGVTDATRNALWRSLYVNKRDPFQPGATPQPSNPDVREKMQRRRADGGAKLDIQRF